MELANIVIGESITLHEVILRVGFFIDEQKKNRLNLFVLPIPKSNYFESQIIASHNRISICGKLILFGVPNHWVYEIDLRCLEKQYERLVFAVSSQSGHIDGENFHVNLLANIEKVGKSAVNLQLPTSHVLRVFEVYSYQNSYRIKGYNDIFSPEKFSAYYSKSNVYEYIAEPMPYVIDKANENKILKTLLTWPSFGFNASVNYKISLLGARSVGKTSIVAAMNDHLSKVNATAKMELTTINSIYFSDFLENALDRFLYDERRLTSYPDKDLPYLDDGCYDYKATLVEENTSFDLNLFFSESRNAANGSLINEANINLIKESHVVIFPIDAAALMEQRGRWHELINKARELTDLCKNALINFNEPKLILLVPIKSETYLHNRSADHLLFAIEENYASFLNFIRYLNSVSCAVVPVQTFGHIILRGVVEDNDYPEFIFSPRHENATYSPRDADQLWTYILTFLLAQTLRLNRMKLLLAPPNPIHEVLKELLIHRKQGAEGFKIFQGFREMG